jgi:hypothetical protein
VRREVTTGGVTPQRDTDVRDLSRQECMAEVAARVSANIGGKQSIPKIILNSIYWALTGEPFARKKVFHTQASPDTGDLRRAVALQAGFHYPYDLTADGRRKRDTPKNARAYNVPELRSLVRALRETTDQRPDPSSP